MDQAVGYRCKRCKQIDFGLAWHFGVRVIYSSCTCGGETIRRMIPYDTAKQLLGNENSNILHEKSQVLH